MVQLIVEKGVLGALMLEHFNSTMVQLIVC